MTINDAKKIYAAIDDNPNAFSGAEWLQIAKLIELCRAASSLAEAAQILTEAGYGYPERCARIYRGETSNLLPTEQTQ